MNDNPILIVSADGHCGQTVAGFRDYLERKWHDEFDTWAASFVDPFEDLNHIYSERNWDSALRQRHLEADGIVGEVLYPNTVAPFHPVPSDLAAPPSRDEYERRRAGAHAYNRWLKDFCDDVPGRRAGIAEVLFNNPEHTVEDIKWARDNGLFGGIMLPPLPPGNSLPGIWDPSFDRIWDACVDLDVPVNHHGGGGTGDYGYESGIARFLYLSEFAMFSNRVIWHMVWGGVFARHPKLRFVITEQGFSGILDQCHYQDYLWAMLKGEGDSTAAQGAREMLGDFIEGVPVKPSDYIRSNCWFGASFLSAREVARRNEIGSDRIMWGCDYPHTEATWPNSRGAIADAVIGVPEREVFDIVGLTAAQFYGFDLNVLRNAAASIGPKRQEILRAA
jgi:predicted TIM-barrel fold metal-dependent hydrolase